MRRVCTIDNESTDIRADAAAPRDQRGGTRSDLDGACIFQLARTEQKQRLDRIRAEMAELGADWI